MDTRRKDVAPSDALRRWFGNDLTRCEEFRRRYEAELGPGVRWLLERARAGRLTLCCGARDPVHN